MATPNYAFAKRQKELAKKQKKEEKKLLKQANTTAETPENLPTPPVDKPAAE
jgi:hypothetical protein